MQEFTATNSLGQTTITGEYRAMVYSDPNNDFCAGCLDFFVRWRAVARSIDDIERITLASFGSFLTERRLLHRAGSVPAGVDPGHGGPQQ